MTTTHPDVAPGTVPAWVLRCAYDGEEWLVLADIRPPLYRSVIKIMFGPRWSVVDGLWALEFPADGMKRERYFDGLAEAHAAFERIEAAWRERER